MFIRPIGLALSLLALSCGAPLAQTSPQYQTPDSSLQAIVDAPLAPITQLGPQRQTLLQIQRPGLPSLTLLAQPELRLAGLRLNAKMHAASRTIFGESMQLIDVASGQPRSVVGLPKQARIADAQYAPDERSIAVSLWQDDGVKLYLVDVASGRARLLLKQPLNATVGAGFSWQGADRLLVQLVAQSGPAPQAPLAPSAPKIEESQVGKLSQTRTFPDLLKSPFDADLLDWQLTSQLASIKLNGQLTRLGQPARILSASTSPDGRYLLVNHLQRPYSTQVPLSRFPLTSEVWTATGKRFKTIHQRPLLERMPPGNDAVEDGPRDLAWRADSPATLYWAQALDGGDPSQAAPFRDALMLQAAPFNAAPVQLGQFKTRLVNVSWGRDDLALVTEYWWKTRDLQTWRVQPGKPEQPATLLFKRKSEDRYNDPGKPMLSSLPSGKRVLQTSTDGLSIYLKGEGASSEGDRPFLDKFNLNTLTSTRLWRSEAPFYEEALALLDNEAKHWISTREAPDAFPNLYVREQASSQLRALTHTPHPLPQLKEIQMQTLRYARADGVKLSGKLYLPPGYQAGRDGPLPTLLWAYPQEFKSAEAASQISDSPYRFKRISPLSPLTMLARGFAVLDDPSMPIVGEGDSEPNDSYLQQLTASAQAAVDELVRLGVGDRNRMAVGGHSYGAFMTANLLAHTRLFKAGIARSGAYNRTLTPFGFQAEDRNYWEAQTTYQTMSPFNYADKINDALLIIHGAEDANPGTFPIQSERLFQALQGLGKRSRLVMLPLENHGYRARESVLHTLWEQDRWLTEHLQPRS